LIVLGVILDLGGGPDHDRIGFRYWKNPGPFVQYDGIAGAKGRFLGFSKVFTQAAFSYIGTEIVAVSSSSLCRTYRPAGCHPIDVRRFGRNF
jgi:amino acid transporter